MEVEREICSSGACNLGNQTNYVLNHNRAYRKPKRTIPKFNEINRNSPCHQKPSYILTPTPTSRGRHGLHNSGLQKLRLTRFQMLSSMVVLQHGNVAICLSLDICPSMQGPGYFNGVERMESLCQWTTLVTICEFQIKDPRL